MLRAYALPHPPLAVAGIGDNQKKDIQKTLESFEKVAEEIAEFAPDVIIYVTPHNIGYADYFHISPGLNAKGDFTGFGAPNVSFEMEYAEKLRDKIVALAEENNLFAGYLGEEEADLDHGVMVPMWFINQKYKNYKMIRISQSGMEPSEHYRLGQIIADAVNELGTKTVFIASGDMSHKASEASSYGFVPEGPLFDKTVVDVLASGDFFSLFTIPRYLRECAAECGYNSYMILAGCFDGQKVEANLFSYEAPFGVGYAIASFTQGEADDNRNFLEQYIGFVLDKAVECKKSEDAYQNLARQSLEHAVQNDKILPLPENLPKELLEDKAGVFVSLHKNGLLRGCIGTIAPTTDNIALEIIQNAVSAGLADNRFEPVTAIELPFLTYKVDVLLKPEPVSSLEELDVKRYGVIVSCGGKRGLLLPNLDGIDTVEEQVSIAKNKGGIGENEEIKLERFEVIRHEGK